MEPRALDGGARSFSFLLCTYVFYNLPVSGIQGQTEIKHTKFKTNKLTAAACVPNKAENDKTSKKGFMGGGSDGVDHVAREVL